MIYFASSIKKNIVVPPSCSRSSAKLIYCVTSASASTFCCLLLSIALNFMPVFQTKDNLVNNQLRNHHLDQLKFFEYYHMFLNYFLLVDQK